MINNIGIGLDIENINRFTKLDLKKNRNFFDRIYTRKEKKYSLSKPNPSSHFAVRFAGKEAVLKAINNMKEIKFPLDYKKIEIINNNRGVPLVEIKDKRLKDLEVKISLSHCSDKAIAICFVAKKYF